MELLDFAVLLSEYAADDTDHKACGVILVFYVVFDALLNILANYAFNSYVKTSFLFNFAHDGLLDGFARVHSAAGQCPITDEGAGFAFYEQDLVVGVGDYCS